MTDKKKIEILQEENARLRKELNRLNYLTSDNVSEYVNDFERANRELFAELQELRDNYREYSGEVARLLQELEGVSKSEKLKKWKFWKR